MLRERYTINESVGWDARAQTMRLILPKPLDVPPDVVVGGDDIGVGVVTDDAMRELVGGT